MSASGDLSDFTDLCQQCETYRDRCAEPNLLVVHINRNVICAGKKTPSLAPEKKKTLRKLEKIVSALRNSGGGHVVVHVEGQKDDDQYLQHLDEFITGSFSDLIEDGQLYVEAYNRQWLSGLEHFETFSNAVLINVAESTSIATVDFNTKVNNDIENKSPSALNIAVILFKELKGNITAPKILGLLDVQLLHENRRIEIKSRPADRVIQGHPTELVDHIWNNLKLKDNLTSMSKVLGGGSYYVGISEKNITVGDYKTKTPQIEGFPLQNVEETVGCLKNKVKDCVLVLKDRIFGDAPDDLIKIKFHRLPDTSPTRYVLEVAVRYFDGVVFYDKQGPRTYQLQDKTIIRVDKKEWLSRFVDRFQSYVKERHRS